MRNIFDKISRENQNTYFRLNNFFSENRAVYETMSEPLVEPERLQMTTQHGAYVLHTAQARLHARSHTETNM
jgi:hypothetical protein